MCVSMRYGGLKGRCFSCCRKIKIEREKQGVSCFLGCSRLGFHHLLHHCVFSCRNGEEPGRGQCRQHFGCKYNAGPAPNIHCVYMEMQTTVDLVSIDNVFHNTVEMRIKLEFSRREHVFLQDLGLCWSHGVGGHLCQ